MKVSSNLFLSKDACDFAAERFQESSDGLLRALGERPLMDRTPLGGHSVAFLEIFDVGRTRCDRTQIGHRAEFARVEARGHGEFRRWQGCRDSLHEIGPDRQRNTRGIRLTTDCRWLIEADPDTGDDRRREPDEPRVSVIVGRARFAANRTTNTERSCRTARASIDHVAKHTHHLKGDLRRDHGFRCLRRPQPTGGLEAC